MVNVQSSKSVATRLVTDIFNSGNMQAFDELFADDYVNHTMPMPGVPGTKDGFRQVVLATRQALPDVHVQIEQIVSEGDMVVFHDHATATSEGEFMGIPPTGKRLQWTEMHMLRVRGDQIVEHWANFDQLSMLQQLGAIRP
jgi:steroid delta-isomerase-like uncharacterized protein